VRYSAPAPGPLPSGQTLVLSAGTLSFDGNHPGNATLQSPDACRSACMALPGCGGWVFCGNGMAGCGAGCKAYAKQHPKRKWAAAGLCSGLCACSGVLLCLGVFIITK